MCQKVQLFVEWINVISQPSTPDAFTILVFSHLHCVHFQTWIYPTLIFSASDAVASAIFKLLRVAGEKSQRPAKGILHKIILLNSYVTLIMTNDLCGLPRWLRGKESTCQAGDMGSIPGSRRFPGEGNGNTFQYSCLGNPMDRGAWQATVHRVTKSWTRLSDQTTTTIAAFACAKANYYIVVIV